MSAGDRRRGRGVAQAADTSLAVFVASLAIAAVSTVLAYVVYAAAPDSVVGRWVSGLEQVVAPESRSSRASAAFSRLRMAVASNDLETLIELSEQFPTEPVCWSSRGLVELRLGKHDESLASFEKAAEHARDPQVIANARYNQSCAHALSGRPDEAFKALHAATDEGWTHVRHARQDPDLESIRDDPRFEAWVDRVRSLRQPSPAPGRDTSGGPGEPAAGNPGEPVASEQPGGLGRRSHG